MWRWIACAFVALMNAFDAWATLVLIRRGATEANPIARWVMEHGLGGFWAWKICLATACAVCLASAARRHRLARIALLGLIAGFAALTALHIYLLTVPAVPIPPG